MMEIKLEHRFWKRCYDIPALLKDCNKLSTFSNRLEKQGIQKPDNFSYPDYVGWGFEALIEALIKLSPVDNRIGIINYHPVQQGDTGVDGFGDHFNGLPATVQCKYRGRGDKLLEGNKDHLVNFLAASVLRYHVPQECKKEDGNMTVYTTAKGLNAFTDDSMLLGKVRCINGEQLRSLLDGNTHFWNILGELVK